MPIRVMCPNCSAELQFDDSAAGTKTNCRACRQRLFVPNIDPRFRTMLAKPILPPVPEVEEPPVVAELSHDNQQDYDQPPEPEPEFLLRCYQCGAIRTSHKMTRREVRTGQTYSVFGFGWGHGSGSSTSAYFSREDLCLPCARRHDERIRSALIVSTIMTVFCLMIIIFFLGCAGIAAWR